MAGIDIAILVAFIAYSLWAGMRARRAASEDLEQYFLAGRTLPGWKAGLSMAATQFAADTPLLVTGLIATAGLFSLWRLWIYAIAFLLLGYVLAASWRRAGVITDAQLTELRFGGRAAAVLRGVKAIYFGTVFNCVVLSFVLLAATRIAEPFLVWHEWLPAAVHGVAVDVVEAIGVPLTFGGGDDVWIRSADNLISILAILLVTTLYSTTGGLRSVVATDVVQIGIMLVATAAFAWFVVDRVGGLDTIPDTIRTRYGDGGGPGGIAAEQILAFTPSYAKDVELAVLGVIGLQWLAQMNADGTGYLAQRVMACRSDRDARRATVWFTVTQILVRSVLWIVLGLGLLLMFPPDPTLPLEQARAERELTYVLGLAELPAGLRGLLLTAMLAALASTVDTHLNWGSSYWTNDIYKRFICRWRNKTPTDRSLVWVARGANLLILSIALVVMTQLDSIATAWQTSLLLGAGMGGMLVLRWLWWRVTAWGELGAIVGSAVLAPILLGWDEEALRLLVMFAASTGLGIAISLVTPPDMAGLVEFYRRARPPGYWAPVARAAELDATTDRRRLWLGLALTAIAALTIFLALVTIGSLIAGSAAPAWFPSRPAWLVTTGIGAAMLAFAWRRLERQLDALT